MNELTKHLQEVLEPKAALIAYRYESNSYSDRQKYYLELRPVNKEGKMDAAVPVSHEFVNMLTENYSVDMTAMPYGKIPPNLLWCNSRKGHEKYVWYNPPGRRRMFFRESLNIENGEFNLPGIIYVAEKDRLSVHAFKGEVPEEADRLYLTPYFNVTKGSVCLGSSSLPVPQNPTFSGWMEYWEKRFWMSEFSHLGEGGNPTKSNLVLVTENARNKPFDYGELKPSDKRLKDLFT
ncbi:MAG: prokaryotic E2 ligase family D protein [Parabacteroides sp.]|nr:prokaryotic E2 ligase family D protein [Parabacteroides sp.]